MSQLALFQRCVIAQSHPHALSGFAAVPQLCSPPAQRPVLQKLLKFHLLFFAKRPSVPALSDHKGHFGAWACKNV